MTHLLLSGEYHAFIEHLERLDLPLQPLCLSHVAEHTTRECITSFYDEVSEHWVAYALYARQMIDDAWEIRGDDLARRTDEEALRTHAEMIMEAFPIAQKAYELSRHAYAFEVWAICFMVLVRDPQPLIDVFEDYCEHNEPDLYAIDAVVHALMSKWCAFSLDEWLAWTDTLRTRFAGPLPHFTFVEGAIRMELYGFYHDQFSDLYTTHHDYIVEDFKRMKFATMVYPVWKVKALNLVAYELYWAGEYRKAHEALELCDWLVLSYPWRNDFAGKQEVLDEVRIPWWKFWIS